jgi:BioD-like phosphotransacetylase family protein
MTPKRIFIAATGQDDGKTTVSLGLIAAFSKRFGGKIGFIKPVGQRYVEERGHKVDEDSVLIERVCGIDCSLADMSPIAVERGFTANYVLMGDQAALRFRIQRSFLRVAEGKELVVIEGTGHAGVGSVFDLSNAAVAKMLESKVILITQGGLGRPVDEIVLNKALFDAEGVEMVGVIVNKILRNQYDRITDLLRRAFERKGIRLLGAIPYHKSLTEPTMEQVRAEIRGTVLCGEHRMANRVHQILVGAMEPRHALRHFRNGSLIITPGDREDLIFTGRSSHRLGAAPGRDGADVEPFRLAGFVLTGGLLPHRTTIELLDRADVPVIAVEDTTYEVASKIHDLTVKLLPTDEEKIRIATELVEEYVDLDAILEQL